MEEGGFSLPITLPIRERDSVVLCLEIDDDGLLLLSILLRRELKLEREEFEFVAVSREADEDGVLGWIVMDSPRLNLEFVEGMVIELDRGELEFGCVLGVVIEGRCVVIELPMRDEMEELILPLEFAVERLLTFEREFIMPELVVELLPNRLPLLIDPVDLLVEDELDGSLPTLTLPEGLDGVLRFVIILLELLLDVMALELRLGIEVDGRLVTGARLVILLVEVLRLGAEMLGLLGELTDRELLTLLRLLLVFEGREA